MRFAVAILTLFICTALARAADWPAWRGPTGQGFCEEKNLPLKWSKTENVKWKVPLKDQGNSTPIIWKDKIFLTQANKGGSIRSLLCLDRKDGKLLWQKDIPYEEKERNWNESWYGNASPATDGERVIVSLGSAGMYCFDFTGKELWSRTDLGKWGHDFGNASSPVLYGDLCILWCGPNDGKGDGKGRNFLLAVDKKTGSTVWEHNEKAGSWGTPVLTKVNGQDQLILSPGFKLKGFDPATGKELWVCEGLTVYVYTSPLVGNGVAVAMSGYYGTGLAVKLGGKGDITKDRLWDHPKNIQRVGSGMLIGEHVYIVEENGTPHCYELMTGKEVWQVGKQAEDDKKKKSGLGTTWGSMIHSDGRLYVLMRNGETVILKASPKFELIGINSLGAGEQTNSSIAVSDGELFIRTFRNLWCISAKK